MKRIICILFIIGIGIPSISYSASGIEHIRAWEKMLDVPIKFGGLGGGIPKDDLPILQTIIDGKGGNGHRDDGSHDPKTMMKFLSGEKRWEPMAVFNAVVIHNIMDMAHKGPKGSNGWKSSPERHAKAKELRKRIENGKPIKAPKWATKMGKEAKVVVKAVYKTVCKNAAQYAESIKRSVPKKVVKYVKNIFKVGGKWVQKIGPVVGYIIVIYEGGEFIYKYTQGEKIQTKDLVDSGVSAIAGFGGAAAGAAAGAWVCSPVIETIIVYGG